MPPAGHTVDQVEIERRRKNALESVKGELSGYTRKEVSDMWELVLAMMPDWQEKGVLNGRSREQDSGGNDGHDAGGSAGRTDSASFLITARRTSLSEYQPLARSRLRRDPLQQ